MQVRLALAVALIFALCPKGAYAQCSPAVEASCLSWTLPPGLVLVGAAAGTVDPEGVYTIRPKNTSGAYMANVPVTIEWNRSDYPYLVCANQPYPGMGYTYSGGVHQFTTNTDAFGYAMFCIAGAGYLGTSCPTLPSMNFGKARVKVCGVQLNPTFGLHLTIAGANYDESNDGVGPADLSRWQADYFCYANQENDPAYYVARADLDGSQTLGPADYSKLLDIYFSSSVNRCP